MSLPPTDLAVLALATWRLSSLLSSEDGPYNALARFRRLAGVRYDEHSLPYGANEFARMLLCPWCNSVWIGVAFALAYLLWPGAVWVLLPLALSGAAALGQTLAGR